MKLIINETQRGFLFKNGVYKKVLMPGKHYIKSIFGETFALSSVFESVNVPAVDISVLLRDKAFRDGVSCIDVPDGQIAIHKEDGRIVSVLKAGTHCFWNDLREHTFDLVTLSDVEITKYKPEELAAIPANYYKVVNIPTGETGLLYIGGKFERELESGTHYLWDTMQKISFGTVDMRSQQLDIAGQEILTADKVSLRINFVCTYKVTDAVKIIGEIKDYKAQIYTLTQLALREYVGNFRFDELLEQKDSIAAFVLNQLQAKQETLFVEFSDAGLKDIILPGEIRDIMNTVLVAEKNAQANVIARREEVASTRSLLNTAKLMEENATLYKLKELEYLEKICDKVGNISVSGGNLLTELREIVSA